MQPSSTVKAPLSSLAFQPSSDLPSKSNCQPADFSAAVSVLGFGSAASERPAMRLRETARSNRVRFMRGNYVGDGPTLNTVPSVLANPNFVSIRVRRDLGSGRNE